LTRCSHSAGVTRERSELAAGLAVADMAGSSLWNARTMIAHGSEVWAREMVDGWD
jgi:hypothetical protein